MKRAARDGAAIAAALLVASAAVASCNFLVGVGDYSVGDAEADGPGGGPGDDASMPVDAGIDQGSQTRDGQADSPVDARNDRADVGVSDARLPDAGPLLDAGPDRAVGIDSGTVDTGVDVGLPDAEAGPPAVCGQGIPTGQASFQQLVTSCVLAVSCDPYLFPISLSDCITQNSFQAISGLSCLSTITSCTGATDSYYTCAGTRLAVNECASTSTSSCVNNVAFDCSGAIVTAGVATNCSVTGGTCQTYTDGTGESRADCAVIPSCPVTDGGAQCLGGDLYNCLPPTGVGTAGVGFGISCAAVDATCATTAAQGTSCYFNGSTTCANPGSVSCGGASTLDSCQFTGQQLAYDCSRAGGACAPDTSGGAVCVSPGCSVSSSCVESCGADGETITACVGGAPYTIDCAQYNGFASCGSTNGLVYCL